jgi:phosphoglycerol transferase MdoB-like AlkP superfamily enzyme
MTAFWLYVAAAALSLVSLIVSLVTFGGTRDVVARQLANEGVEVSDSAINALLGVTIAISILFAVIWIAAFVLFAVFMKRGANWARIVLTVITVLSLVNILSGFGLGALQVVASVIATILIWLRPASEYFAAVKARKGGAQAY